MSIGENDDRSCSIALPSGMFPNLASGVWHGVPFLFRARHEEWELRIGAEKNVVAKGSAEYAGGWDQLETLQHLQAALVAWETSIKE